MISLEFVKFKKEVAMQIGRIKQLALTIAAMTMIGNAYAVDPGFYLGLMTGPATNSAGTQQVQTLTPPPPTVLANPKSSQFGSSVYMGYKFNPYAGFEMGLMYFTSIKFQPANNVQTCSGSTVRVRNIDVLGKVELPFKNWFDLFAKGGVGYTYVTKAGALNTDLSEPCGKSSYETKVRPIIAIGADYNVNQNFVIDASWTRIMVGSIVGNVDFFAVGFSYHFVNEYCGQFLCN